MNLAVPRLLIIAFGNPLRSDDGLAWRVAEELAKIALPSDVEIITQNQLTPEVAPLVSQATMTLFIDAARGGIAGEVTAEPLQPEAASSVFTHEYSPGVILALAQRLYGRCAKGFAISICGECFDHGETLSAKVEENLPRAVALAKQFLYG